ncbi:MAG: ribosome recycling factor [Candidatus Pacebacteria bacterium]|nr:ribosome recycling factor [Candidatus Paceibacterota bacterium]
MADDSYLISLKEAIKQHLSLFETNLSSIRSGKVNPAIIENISVECYGTRSPLKSLANIILQPPNILIVEP